MTTNTKKAIDKLFRDNYTTGGSFGRGEYQGLCFTYKALKSIKSQIIYMIEKEDECEYCGGEGTVVADAPVYPGEPHMAPIAEVSCICQGDDDIY